MKAFSGIARLGFVLVFVAALTCQQSAIKFSKAMTITLEDIHVSGSEEGGYNILVSDTAFYKEEVNVSDYFEDWDDLKEEIDSLVIDSVNTVIINNLPDSAVLYLFVSDDSTLTYDDLLPAGENPLALFFFQVDLGPHDTVEVNSGNFTLFIPNLVPTLNSLALEILSGHFWFYALGEPRLNVDIFIPEYEFFVTIRGGL